MAAPGRSPPPKPWERAPSTSGPSPFAPPSTASTAEAVATSSANTSAATKPPEQSGAVRTVNDGVQGRVMPLRPWEQGGSGNYNRPYNSYGGGYGYNSGGYGGYGGYGSGMYAGGSMYGGGYGYGGGGGGMYGSGMYGANRYGYGGGGYGMSPYGGYGQPMNPNNPDDPYGGPPRPPGFWQSMLRVMHGVMSFCGRLAILIDENTQAFHFFLTALLQLCDRTGSLYGELARFVLRLLGFRPRSSKGRATGNATALEGTEGKQGALVPSAGASSEGAWDNVWSGDVK